MLTSEQVIEELDKLRNLKKNWNGDGAIAPTEETLQKVHDFIRYIHNNSGSYPNRIKPSEASNNCRGVVGVVYYIDIREKVYLEFDYDHISYIHAKGKWIFTDVEYIWDNTSRVKDRVLESLI